MFAKFVFLSLVMMNVSWARSSDYTCDFRSYRLDIELGLSSSNSLFLTDRYQHDTIANGYSKFQERVGEKIHYYYYPAQSDNIKLTFLYQDMENLPQQLPGQIETKIRGFLVRENFICKKR